MKIWCENHNAKLFVLTTGYFSITPKEDSEPTAAFMLKAEKIFSEDNIPFHDISPEVTSAKTDNYVSYIIHPKDPHPNELGNRLIADYSWKWLRPKFQEIINDKPATLSKKYSCSQIIFDKIVTFDHAPLDHGQYVREIIALPELP